MSDSVLPDRELYRSLRDVPDEVGRAQRLAERVGFSRSCSDAAGRVLATLAATVEDTAAEIGTGCGVGSAWILSGLPSTARLVTVEADPATAAVASETIGHHPNVTLLVGDWRQVLAHGPYSLVFIDVREAKQGGRELIDVLAAGGVVMIDDLTPEWLPRPPRPDRVRELWLNDERFVATEILTTPSTSAIIAVRR